MLSRWKFWENKELEKKKKCSTELTKLIWCLATYQESVMDQIEMCRSNSNALKECLNKHDIPTRDVKEDLRSSVFYNQNPVGESDLCKPSSP